MNPSAISRYEDAGLNASAPRQQRLLDGWLLRFSPGKAKRARCVNALAAGRLPLAEKMALCEQAYAEVALPMIVRITPLSEPPQLDEALATTGWHHFDDTRVMVLPDLHALPASPPNSATLQPVAGDHFAHAIGALRGSPIAQREAHAVRLHNAPVAPQGFVVQRDGETLACGQYAIESDVVGLYDVFTSPRERGRGIARELCHAMLVRARDAGARSAYLQVDAGNDAARAVYRRLGFADAYAYHYRARDPQSA
jgi:ribosomal protein S18 acetylase RimI-like enzyme